MAAARLSSSFSCACPSHFFLLPDISSSPPPPAKPNHVVVAVPSPTPCWSSPAPTYCPTTSTIARAPNRPASNHPHCLAKRPPSKPSLLSPPELGKMRGRVHQNPSSEIQEEEEGYLPHRICHGRQGWWEELIAGRWYDMGIGRRHLKGGCRMLERERGREHM